MYLVGVCWVPTGDRCSQEVVLYETGLVLCCILFWLKDVMVSSHMWEDGHASGFSILSGGKKGGNYQNIKM